MVISFTRLQEYLEAISAKASHDPDDSGHGRFWNTDYNSFLTGTVPTKMCTGQPVPIINQADKVNSAFLLILQASWCSMPKMPRGGPFLTAADYKVTLADGSTRTGSELLADIRDWLAAGAPEHGASPSIADNC